MLEFLGDAGKLRARLRSEKGLSSSRIGELIEQKKKDYAGLLSDDAAVFSIAVEHGLDVDTSPPEPCFTRLSDLNAGEKVNVKGTIERVFGLKRFEKDGRKGSVVNAVISDGSGEARLVLWGLDAEKASKGGLEKGDFVQVLNAESKNGFSGPEISLGFTGSLKTKKKGEKSYSKVSELSEGDEVDLLARVLETGKTTEFERNGKKSTVYWCVAGDETGTVRLVLWDASSETVEGVKQNAVVKIENGVVRKGLGGEKELHVGWAGRVLLNPAEAGALGRHGVPGAPLRKAGELAEGERAEVKAALKEIGFAREAMVCRKCGARCGGLSCPECNSMDLVATRFAEALFAEADCSLNVEFQGDAVLGLLGLKKLAEDISCSTVLGLKGEQLVGREYYLLGTLSSGVFRVESAVQA